MLSASPTWLDRLAAYRVPFTPRAALDYLRQPSARFGILGCYRIFFPAQWAASVAPLLPAPDRAYSAREWEMFRLTNEHLFPLDLDWLADLDEDDPENRTLTLPITPIGIEWWEADLDYFRPGLQMLLVLSGAAAPQYAELLDPVITALRQAGAGQGVPLWLAAPAPVPPPLTALAEAYAWIHHDTGNAWLDATDDNPIDVCWNRPDVEWCARQYREAQALEARIAPLITWLEADPTHILEILALCAPPRPT